MTRIRTKLSSILLIASVMVMASSAIFATPRHEVCDAMRHACDRADEALSCCCGDRSDSNPSQVPGDRANASSTPDLTASVFFAMAMPVTTTLFVHVRPPSLARPPDLRILFRDLRF